MADTIDKSPRIVHAMRREDECDSRKGLTVLLHEDSLPGITFDVFTKTVLHFMRVRKGTPEPSMKSEEFKVLFEKVDFASLFNVIQIAYSLGYHSSANINIMDLACRALINKVKNRTFREMRIGFYTDQECFYVREENPDFRFCTFAPLAPLNPSLYMRLSAAYAKSEQMPDGMELREHRKEYFTKRSMLEDLQLSPLISNHLNFVKRREKKCSDYLRELMECTDFKRLLETINSLSYLISGDRKLADLVDSDIAKYVLEIVRYYKTHDIQCQAVYILSCVSIVKCHDVMMNDVIPLLVKLMSHSFYRLAVAAVIAMTRLANTSPGCIKDILDKGALEAVLKSVKQFHNVHKIICCLAKLLAVICRKCDLPSDKVMVAVTISEELLQNELESDYHKVHACHTLQYLTHGRDVVIGEKVLHKLVGLIYKFLSPEDTLVASSALAVVGNIARWGNPDIIQVLTLRCALLDCLVSIMRCGKFKILWIEACQIISNMAARSGTFTKDMAVEVDLVELLCSLLERGDRHVRREAAWAICNCIYGKRKRLILEAHILLFTFSP